MGSFAAGQVVLVDFPFSDLTASKLRPAVVLADAGRGDWILGQITSNAYGDPRAIPLADADILNGSLHRPSFARPGKLFTAHSKLIAHTIGSLTDAKFITVRDSISQLIQSGGP
jgi:mRNA interferase MazF